MKTTAESSMPMMQTLNRTVPSHVLGQVYALFDELEVLRAAAADTAVSPGDAAQPPDPAKALAKVERANHARGVKSSRLNAAVAAAVEHYRLKLEEMVRGGRHSPTSRMEHLRKLIAADLGKAREMVEEGKEIPPAYAAYLALGRVPGKKRISGELKRLSL